MRRLATMPENDRGSRACSSFATNTRVARLAKDNNQLATDIYNLSSDKAELQSIDRRLKSYNRRLHREVDELTDKLRFHYETQKFADERLDDTARAEKTLERNNARFCNELDRSQHICDIAERLKDNASCVIDRIRGLISSQDGCIIIIGNTNTH